MNCYGAQEIVYVHRCEMQKVLRTQESRPSPRIKRDVHPQKTTTCVQWDSKSLVEWKMIEENETTNKDLCAAQLHQMSQAMRLK